MTVKLVVVVQSGGEEARLAHVECLDVCFKDMLMESGCSCLS